KPSRDSIGVMVSQVACMSCLRNNTPSRTYACTDPSVRHHLVRQHLLTENPTPRHCNTFGAVEPVNSVDQRPGDGVQTIIIIAWLGNTSSLEKASSNGRFDLRRAIKNLGNAATNIVEHSCFDIGTLLFNE